MASANSAPPATFTPPEDERSIFSRRSRRQLGIWAAGAGFMLFSAAITRRAVARRNNWARPLFFYTNMEPHLKPINGPLEALEALSVATINAFSFGIMFTGGMFWAFDISNLEELKRRTRDKLGYEKAIEAEQMSDGGVTQEQWLTSVVVDEEEQRIKGAGKTLAHVNDKIIERPTKPTSQEGGPLDQLAQQTADSMSKSTKGWMSWWTGK
ncbi:uncharacterized protein PV09_04792 [Verruconis gallopava]|uniref:Altered inheritance of mitochondria protein 11 n=1 Tax=Verruconis gallopava TaxID=253628 RepID=A0A0D1XN01_9PEZI|nr:uncharacterized protein PV09_04792 [Verruconis gallopava]KIW03956.1 hypothetical protein PV09_04792 [Verruconis gallopava]